jgi:3-deoxy-D-manno-octulosonic-acid transferase
VSGARPVERGGERIVADPNPGLLRALLHGAYDLLWLTALLVLSPWFLGRALVDPRYRRMARERLALELPRLDARRRVLIHGVSVGEVKGAAPLVRALAEHDPELEIVICTTTATGLEVARQTFPQLAIVRFPIDLSWCVRRFLRAVAPHTVVLIELEIWPNFLRECNRLGATVAVVNGRITAQSYDRYHWFRQTLPQFNRITLFCVQMEEYAERFRRLGGASERVLVTGNMKADGLLREPSAENLAKVEQLRRLLAIAPERPTLVAGSTHQPEEAWFVETCRSAVPNARLVVVPRHPPRAADVQRELAALGAKPQLLTELRRGAEAPDPSRPALVDTIGELEAIYALADIVFVGGSLIPHGGQNMLEPAAQRCAVVYGPHVDNFRQEAALLESAGAARRVADRAELARCLAELAGDAPRREHMAQAGAAAVQRQKGATRLTLRALVDRCLPPHAAGPVEPAAPPDSVAGRGGASR